MAEEIKTTPAPEGQTLEPPAPEVSEAPPAPEPGTQGVIPGMRSGMSKNMTESVGRNIFRQSAIIFLLKRKNSGQLLISLYKEMVKSDMEPYIQDIYTMVGNLWLFSGRKTRTSAGSRLHIPALSTDSSSMTMARLCPYCQHKIEMPYRGTAVVILVVQAVVSKSFFHLSYFAGYKVKFMP